MTKSLQWVRLYVDAYRHPKVKPLSDKLFRFWVSCMCLAGENDGILPRAEYIASYLGITSEQAASRTEELLKARLVDSTPLGYSLHNWDDRQYTERKSTERVRKFRSKRLDETHETHETVSETGETVSLFHETSHETRNAPETETETESDTETEKKHTQSVSCAPVSIETKKAGSPAGWAEKLYDRHPKKRDRVLVEQAVVKVWQRTPDLLTEIDRVHALWCKSGDWTKENGRYAPKLAEWLEDRGWTARPREPPMFPVKSKLAAIMDQIHVEEMP